MAAKTYLQQLGGRLKQIAATAVSTGAPNGGDIVALTDAGVLDISLLPSGFAPATWTGVASEAIGSGKLVNIWSDSGVAKARLADASAVGKRAMGYVPTGVASGATVTVWFAGANSSVSGLTPGTDVFLATTPGGVTSTAPSGSGQIVQRVGIAATTSAFMFAPSIETELLTTA